MKSLIKIRLNEALSENIQLADKLYFKTGKLPPEVRDAILSITQGDNYTKIMCDFYVYLAENPIFSKDMLKTLREIYEQLKTYNKNIVPIKGLNVNTNYDMNQIGNLMSALHHRAEIMKMLEKLPSVALRNLRPELKVERDAGELGSYEQDLEYFVSHYSMLSNRDENMRKKIEAKMFKAGVTLDDLVDFVETKENLLGGANFTRKKIIDIIKEDGYDLEMVYDKNNVMVVDVTGPDGIKKIGCNSLWCFTYGSGFDSAYRTWNNYSTNDHVYAIIDFSKPSDAVDFMYVLIKPLDFNTDDSNEENDDSLFNMSNEAEYHPVSTISELVGLDTAKRLFNFGEEPEEEEPKPEPKPVPFKDPNQMSLFESIKKSLRKSLNEVIYTSFLNWFKQYEHTLTNKGIEAEFNLVNDKLVTIEIIGVPEGQHGEGIGTGIMNTLCKKADELGVVLQLRPAASSTHSRTKLIKFYSKFGFVQNIGSNKNDKYQYMYRLPKP